MPYDFGLALLGLVLIGAPTGALMLDRVKEYPAPKFFKRQGLPALIVFIALAAYLGYAHDPLLELLFWGAIGGLAGTLTLDVVRLIGVKFNAFPIDVPQMFGAMALGVAPKLPKNVMGRMVVMLADLPEPERRQMMESRIGAMSQLPEGERKMFVGMMMDGLKNLPQEKRDRVMKTQMEVLSALPQENRANMMKTMDALGLPPTAGSNADAPRSPMGAFREGRMPRMPMGMFRELAGKWGIHTKGSAFEAAAKESGVSSSSLLLAGYLWHAVNGATYGMAFTLLFGAGSWWLAFAWGTFVWLVMMVSMPRMMPMVKLPYPKFMVVPLLAHWAMALPIGYFALAYVSPAASADSILHALLNLG